MFPQSALNVTTAALQSVAEYTGFSSELITPVVVIFGVVLMLGIAGDGHHDGLHFHNSTVKIYVNEEEEEEEDEESSSTSSTSSASATASASSTSSTSSASSTSSTSSASNSHNNLHYCVDEELDSDECLMSDPYEDSSLLNASPSTPMIDLSDRGGDHYWSGFN